MFLNTYDKNMCSSCSHRTNLFRNKKGTALYIDRWFQELLSHLLTSLVKSGSLLQKFLAMYLTDFIWRHLNEKYSYLHKFQIKQ